MEKRILVKFMAPRLRIRVVHRPGMVWPYRIEKYCWEHKKYVFDQGFERPLRAKMIFLGLVQAHTHAVCAGK